MLQPTSVLERAFLHWPTAQSKIKILPHLCSGTICWPKLGGSLAAPQKLAQEVRDYPTFMLVQLSPHNQCGTIPNTIQAICPAQLIFTSFTTERKSNVSKGILRIINLLLGAWEFCGISIRWTSLSGKLSIFQSSKACMQIVNCWSCKTGRNLTNLCTGITGLAPVNLDITSAINLLS